MAEVIEPLFLLDSRTWLRPVAVETILEVPGVEIIRAPIAQRPALIPGPLVTLDQLADGAVAIDFPSHPEKWAPTIQGNPVGYKRTVRGGGLLWEQFWLFYLHNPKRYATIGEHEGDWEMVQIGYAALPRLDVGISPTPVCMTFSQHHGSQAVMWWNVSLGGTAMSTGRTFNPPPRPMVWVANGSQACYPRQLLEPHGLAQDVADGGVPLEIEWRDFGPWAKWKGRWGNSKTSPVSPAHHLAWGSPHLYHEGAVR